MKVKDLKTILDGLNEFDDEREILMSSDPEGNEIMDVCHLSAEDMFGEKDAVILHKPALVIWPKHRR